MSEILKRWRAGEGLPDVLVIDGHTHVGAWPTGANFNSIDEAAEGSIAAMDANGVDASCVLGGGYMGRGNDYTLGNDALIELVSKVPDRIIGFAHVNPSDGQERNLAELERVVKAGIRCIKLINDYQNYPGDGPNLMAVYDFAAQHNMLILNHQWSAEHMIKIAPKFPSVDFIQGHYGGGWEYIMKRFPNVYANIWSLGDIGFIERGVAHAGPEKFMFGSDAFMNPVSVGIGLVVYADIPDDHKRLMLGLNVARLLEKVGALPEALRSHIS